jgi:hypothetical protein
MELPVNLMPTGKIKPSVFIFALEPVQTRRLHSEPYVFQPVRAARTPQGRSARPWC